MGNFAAGNSARMKTAIISHTGSRRLILIFAGWGMDARPFAGLSRNGYDIALVWDYRDLHFDTSFVAPYSEICLIAWSLGVRAAAEVLAPLEHKITRRVAVGGTLVPVDDHRGIPEAVFRGTLEGLSERSLDKFYRRMAGTRAACDEFMRKRPNRDIDGLADELRAFLERGPADTTFRWDLALVGKNDAIFQAENQIEAWQGTPVRVYEGSHLPDFAKLIETYVVDKKLVSERFGRRRGAYEGAAPVQSAIVERLWQAMTRAGATETARNILEVGCGSGFLSRRLAASLAAGASLELWDIAGDSPVEGDGVSFCRCDAELAASNLAPGSLDLICSASTVQWFNSPARFFDSCLRALRPGGYLAVTTFCRGNLAEVEQSTGVGLPLYTPEEWLGAVPAGFEKIECEAYDHCLEFESPLDVFRHLHDTGVNSLGGDHERVSLRKALAAYPCSGTDGRATLTYRPIIMIFRKK